MRKKFTPRAEYRLMQGQRAKDSISLSEKFRDLKSLTVEFAHYTSEGVARNNQIKYTVNPDFARSVFRLDCLNQECVGGDYDLSEALARAMAARQTSVTGEMCCQGWLSKTTIGQVHCHNIMRYKLTLEFGARAPLPKVIAEQPTAV
jgi:hypothetical protein